MSEAINEEFGKASGAALDSLPGSAVTSGDLQFFRTLIDSGIEPGHAIAIASGTAQLLSARMAQVASRADLAGWGDVISRTAAANAESHMHSLLETRLILAQAAADTNATITQNLAETKAGLTKDLAGIDAKLTLSLADTKAALTESLAITERKLTDALADLKTSVVATISDDRGMFGTSIATLDGKMTTAVAESKAYILRTLVGMVGFQTLVIIGAAITIARWLPGALK